MQSSSQRSPSVARSLANLRRIEGQVRALQHQLEDHADFLSVLNQIAAASKALQSVALRLAQDHLSEQVQELSDDPAKAAATSQDLSQIVERLLKI